MNRKARRKAEAQGQRETFDPMQHWKVSYDFHVPPHLMRGDHPSRLAGTIEARDEADLLRGLFLTMMNAAGFSSDQRAVIGVIAEMVNPFSNYMRGLLAYAVIHGQGLSIVESEITVCAECKAEKHETLGTPEEQSDDPDGDVVMRDTTQHDPKCPHADPECPAVPVYTEMTGIDILLPKRYAALNEGQEIPTPADEGATIAEPDTEAEAHEESTEVALDDATTPST
jgi:hypothetical protein